MRRYNNIHVVEGLYSYMLHFFFDLSFKININQTTLLLVTVTCNTSWKMLNDVASVVCNWYKQQCCLVFVGLYSQNIESNPIDYLCSGRVNLSLLHQSGQCNVVAKVHSQSYYMPAFSVLHSAFSFLFNVLIIIIFQNNSKKYFAKCK